MEAQKFIAKIVKETIMMLLNAPLQCACARSFFATMLSTCSSGTPTVCAV